MLRVDDDPLKIVPPKNLNTGNSKDSLGGLSFNASKVSCSPFLLRKKCNQASNGWDFRADAESSAHDPPPVQYAQIGIGRWTWGLKKCPAPILHQVKERPCREHLAWRWNGNWNMARATKNVWKLQPRIFRWKDVTRNIQGEQNTLLSGYTFTLNQLLDEQPSNATERVSFLISRARGLLDLKLICEITSRNLQQAPNTRGKPHSARHKCEHSCSVS